MIIHLQQKKGKQNKKKQQKLRKKKRAKQAKNQTPDSKDKLKATKRNASDSEGTTPKKSKKNEVINFLWLFGHLFLMNDDIVCIYMNGSIDLLVYIYALIT